MFTQAQSVSVLGLACNDITAEIDITGGFPAFTVVGLTDTAIQEAKERLRAAWKNSGLDFPNNYRIIVNLAPADTKKTGSHYDLPIAVGMYIASEKRTDIAVDDAVFAGELALDGRVRPIPGALSIAAHAADTGKRALFLPAENAAEASVIDGITIYPVHSLRQLISHLNDHERIAAQPPIDTTTLQANDEQQLDMADVKGQRFAKRALEIAASGAHNILLNGPPGSGKTLLARTMPSILPPLDTDEAIDVTKIYSIRGELPSDTPLITTRPFRSPHHSASAVALVGGGTTPQPGEISMAHHGVLFLDEFPEFQRHVIEHLRQPLEDGLVTVSRVQGTVQFPANFTLVASQNPCPCGFATDTARNCSCTDAQMARYQKKLSGPLLDRIDLHVEVPRVPFEKLSSEEKGEPSSAILERVLHARKRQATRFAHTPYHTNAAMNNKAIETHCTLNEQCKQLLKQATEQLHLSARSYHRILKVARTIADLADSDTITQAHIAEALQFRRKDVV